jgi:predicted nucleic acid-binding Zn ribbon protein
MPAFQALLQQQQVTAQAVAQLTQIALAPTEITHHPTGHPMAGRVAGARKNAPSPGASSRIPQTRN